jgi:hypothetical protein
MASIERPYRLAFWSAAGALCACCWILAIVSLCAVYDPIWELIGLFQSRLYEIGLAGHGHSHLQGMSRAFRSIWQGNIEQAICYNPGSLYLFTVMIFGLIFTPVIIKEIKKA